MIASNPHTHTTWCDGANSVDAMVQSAMDEGFSDLGFTSHSSAPFDPGCAGVQDMAAYQADVRRAAQQHGEKINISCGIEQDYYSPRALDGLDYIIGAVHYIRGDDGRYHTVDATLPLAMECKDTLYGGDGLALAQGYYDLVVRCADELKPQIIAHFDLLAKFNGDGLLFDETSSAYQAIALNALERVAEILDRYNGLFEVNTRAMASGLRAVPYPAPFLLRRLKELGGRVILSSDCHRAGTLTDGFTEGVDLLKQSGFNSVYALKNGRFVERPL